MKKSPEIYFRLLEGRPMRIIWKYRLIPFRFGQVEGSFDVAWSQQASSVVGVTDKITTTLSSGADDTVKLEEINYIYTLHLGI